MEYEEMEKSKWILPTFPSRENQCQRPRSKPRVTEFLYSTILAHGKSEKFGYSFLEVRKMYVVKEWSLHIIVDKD